MFRRVRLCCLAVSVAPYNNNVHKSSIVLSSVSQYRLCDVLSNSTVLSSVSQYRPCDVHNSSIVLSPVSHYH